MVPQVPLLYQKGHKMSDKVLSDQEIKTLEQQNLPMTQEIAEVTCKAGDTECITRWVQAFSDCA